MIKAFFLDFYGTVVHEDGEIIKKITQIIYDTGEAENMSEIDAFWWNDFQDLFSNSHGNNFTLLVWKSYSYSYLFNNIPILDMEEG